VSRLYVNEPAAQISYAEHRVTIKYKDGLLRSLPVETVEGISVFGGVQVSSQCIAECLRRGIDLQYYSSRGAYFGRLSSTGHVNTYRQKRQAFLSEDEDFRLRFSKRLIAAKINNQMVVVRRYLRSSKAVLDSEMILMRNAEKKAADCETRAELMGFEGSAAKAYYSALGKLVDPSFRFSGRSRRPPRDPFNSMLSLCYTILMYAVYSGLEAKGLNPYFGFLHEDREKHPALAGDLMEEWRAPIADSVVMSLVNGHEIAPANFTTPEGGVFLDKAGMKILIGKLERKFMDKQSYLSYVKYPVTFRHAIDMQANELAKAIEAGDIERYSPIWIRHKHILTAIHLKAGDIERYSPIWIR
jgi:CRISPR-associated protein Cas1